VRGVEVGGLLTIGDDRIYVSLRGKGRVHLGEVASNFGGGGHRNAAGCTVSFAPEPGGVEPAATPPRADRIAAAKARLLLALDAAIGPP